MSKPRSYLIDYKARVFRTVRGFTTEIHFGRQVKHIPGNSEYDPRKSPITIDIRQLQHLLELKAGTGEWYGQKEIIDFGIEIGYYIDRNTGERFATTRGTVHYAKVGAHVVPAVPYDLMGATELKEPK